MMTTHRIYSLLVLGALTALLLGPPRTAQAQDDGERNVQKTGTTAADFLNMPVGARATAMGTAYAAVVDDPTAMYWNPAGLARMTNPTFTAEYATWLAEIDHSFLGVAMPTSLGTFGFSVTVMRSPEMDVTDPLVEGYRTGETFFYTAYTVGLSYARALTDRFAIGGTAKLVREDVSFSSATGLAVDLGTIFTTPFRGVRLGASISNFGTDMQMSGEDLKVSLPPLPNSGSEDVTGSIATDEFSMPLIMRIGLAAEVFETERSRVTLAVDALHPNDNAQYVNLGTEVGLLGDLLMLRAGYNELFLEDSERSFTVGGGLNYRFGSLHFVADYAYEAHEYFTGVNRFTLALGF